MNISASPDSYFDNLDKDNILHRYLSIDLILNYELFCKEIYVNYCEAQAACAL